MAYEPKPGQFSLFKNDRKEKDTHPDYRGDGVTLDGQPCWISAWLKEANGKKFFSISLKLKDAQAQQSRGGGGSDAPGSYERGRSGGGFEPDSEIPFASPWGLR